MYNLLEYRSKYSDTTSSLWFYSKNEATNFDAIQETEFVRQLKNPGDAIVVNEPMFVFTILTKIKEARLKLSEESVTVL